ncbi:MAG: terminase TerL endonuclease subunit, partial [Pseudomonadota bacterium]
ACCQQAGPAKHSPSARGTFLTKDLNVWTAAGAAALDMDGWRKGEASLDRRDFAGAAAPAEDGRGGCTALDLARQHDFSVVATILPQGDKLVGFFDVFATQATIEAEGANALRAWRDAGLIHQCDGYLMDFDAIEACVREHKDHFGAPEIAYDPHFAAQMAQNLEAQYPDALVEVRNTPMTL